MAGATRVYDVIQQLRNPRTRFSTASASTWWTSAARSTSRRQQLTVLADGQAALYPAWFIRSGSRTDHSSRA
jgi:hypothetical protein